MREVDKRTQILRELTGSLGLSDTTVKHNELKKTRPYWSNQRPGDQKPLGQETVDLVISPDADVPSLFRFIVQLEKVLDDYGTHGNITRQTV